jgi:hypothetical protein
MNGNDDWDENGSGDHDDEDSRCGCGDYNELIFIGFAVCQSPSLGSLYSLFHRIHSVNP